MKKSSKLRDNHNIIILDDIVFQRFWEIVICFDGQ